MIAGMLESVVRLNPFKTAESKRLATLFSVVYFAQGMWGLPTQPITIILKERGLSAGQVADFFLISGLPWLIKPVYGLVSDFVPLFGRRRKSYFLLMCGLAAAAGFWLAATDLVEHGPVRTLSLALPQITLPFLGPVSPGWMFTAVAGVGIFTLMGLGLAFTDVLTDAVMVENGRPRGLTGAFQSVQWAAIYAASILVGVVGGHFAEKREVSTTLTIAACFPLMTFVMALLFIHEAPAARAGETFHDTWRAIRAAARGREIWLVSGLIFFFNFSPSFGPAFLYYQTDVLKFSQSFIGVLDSIASVGAILGAFIYAPLSRRLPLRTTVVWVIGLSAVATLGYLLYRDPVSAVVINVAFGVLGMVTQLAFLDLAAKACPAHVEATFFALLMSIYNGGSQLSMNVGGRLYDSVGFTRLVWISAVMTALAWVLVPFAKIDAIERRAREQTESASAPV
jgi:predicted MFS family arabinose efflux permease